MKFIINPCKLLPDKKTIILRNQSNASWNNVNGGFQITFNISSYNLINPPLIHLTVYSKINSGHWLIIGGNCIN